jgi:F0F1-type ATP synthase membrane subunit b/b'
MAASSSEPSPTHGSPPVLLPTRKPESVEILPPSSHLQDLQAIHASLQRLNDRQPQTDLHITELRSDFKHMQRQVDGLKSESDKFRQDIKAESADFRRDMRAEFDRFRQDMREEFSEFRQDMKAESERFRQEMKSESESFRKEMRAEFREYAQDLLSRVDDRISSRLFKWVGGATLSSGALGALGALFLKAFH